MHLILFIFSLLMYQPVGQNVPGLQGSWTGSIDVYDQKLNINITFSYSEGELDGSLDIPAQNAFNLPVEVVESEADSVIFQFQTGTGPAIFHGNLSDTERVITGIFEQLGESFPFTLRKRISSNIARSDFPENELLIDTRAGQISGSLTLRQPDSPIVILLSGSGSQDRDENVAGFRVFRVLSAELHRNGFSSFRFDDRGIGRSEGEQDATLDELAGDLSDIMEYLKMNYGDRFSGIVLLGHSQGGLVSVIASQNKDLSGIVFMGSPFLRGDEIINEQIKLLSQAANVPDEVVEINLAFQQRIYDVVRSNGNWDEIERDLADRLEEQINQLPAQQRQALGDMSSFIQSQINRQLSAAKSRWFKSLIEYELEETISGVNVPMLAIFGEKDMQVAAKSNLEKAEDFKSKHDLNLETVVIPEANHLFQKANTGMPGEYGMLEREFAEGFIETIVEWLRSVE